MLEIVGHEDPAVSSAKAKVSLEADELARIRDEYYVGWEQRERALSGGEDTWPCYALAVASEGVRLAVLAAMPARSRAAVRIVREA